MLRKSKRSSPPKARNRVVEGSFDPAVWTRARAAATTYRLLLEPDPNLGFVGSAVELPTVFADGRTPDDCVQATREALSVAVATMLEAGVTPPAPASAGRRDTQVNVRLTSQERLLLQDAARRLGFKGIADFVRMAAMEHVHSNN